MSQSKKNFDFEKSLAELNQIVEQLEKGGLKLEESLQYYEKGVELSRACQQALESAEQKVKILTEKNGEASLKPFELDDE